MQESVADAAFACSTRTCAMGAEHACVMYCAHCNRVPYQSAAKGAPGTQALPRSCNQQRPHDCIEISPTGAAPAGSPTHSYPAPARLTRHACRPQAPPLGNGLPTYTYGPCSMALATTTRPDKEQSMGHLSNMSLDPFPHSTQRAAYTVTYAQAAHTHSSLANCAKGACMQCLSTFTSYSARPRPTHNRTCMGTCMHACMQADTRMHMRCTAHTCRSMPRLPLSALIITKSTAPSCGGPSCCCSPASP